MDTTVLQIALGGAIGASARHLTSIIAVRLMGHGFPWGTIAVNVLGSFAMGVVIVVLAEKSGNRLAPLLVTGMLGGFTTFSTFSLDAMTIYERGQLGVAAVYITASVLLSLGAIFAGFMLARNVL